MIRTGNDYRASIRDGREVWINGDRDHNRKRPVRSVSSTASTPIGAVAALVAKLKAEARAVSFEEIGW